MCRSNADGGRRCPVCDSTSSRSAHNARRRHNLAVRRAIGAWAEQAGEPEAVVAGLRNGPPAVAKQWAADRGLDTGQLAAALTHPGPDPQPDLVAEGDAAVWAATVDLIGQIGAITADQGIRPGEAALLSGVPINLGPPPILGTGDTVQVELDTGVLGYHKPFTGTPDYIAADYGHSPEQIPIHEVAAWRVAHSLGPPWDQIVPPVVLRPVDRRLGSFAHGCDGTEGSSAAAAGEDLEDRAAFFDSLIGQQDRNPANALSGSGLALIDHGYAFPASPVAEHNVSMFEAKRWSRLQQRLTPREAAVLGRLLADPTLAGLTQILPPDRSAELRDRAAEMRRQGQIRTLR